MKKFDQNFSLFSAVRLIELEIEDMCGRAAVVLAFALTMVGREGNEADCLCGDIEIVLDKALVVVENFLDGCPFARFVLRFDLIVLDEALGEAEGSIIMACRHKEDH